MLCEREKKFRKEVVGQEWVSTIGNKNSYILQKAEKVDSDIVGYTPADQRFVFKEEILGLFSQQKSIVFFSDRSPPFVQEKTGIPFISLCLHF